MNQPINQPTDQERLKLIDELLRQAMELEGEALAEFLDRACAGDAGLRPEVEQMLGGEIETGEFLKYSPAPDFRWRVGADSLTGAKINHYIIESSIGRGGMGEVYLARDEQLRRRVAIKILPPEFLADPERVRRFEQEALTISALNHPNIVTIHEVGQSGPIHFIVTEYIDGQTLRERLSAARLPIPAALDIALQIASAIAAAHDAGIVHRDIKPENIMLRRDGYVKTLDFGLAKLRQGNRGTEGQKDGETERWREGSLPIHNLSASPSSLSPSPPPSVSHSLTNPGAMMGTVRYMSPEQARGAQIDHRTDLFSLGVVLYEMAAGCRPFEGAANTEVLASILESEPSSLRRLSPEAPEELEMILSQALRKERTDRYQTAGEMIDDLKRLKQELDLKALAERAAPNIGGTPHVSLREAGASHDRIRKSRPAILIGVALVIAVSGLIAWASYRLIRSRQIPDRSMKMTKLAVLGAVKAAAISPDGQYVAYSTCENGQHSLWVRVVATTDVIQLLPPANGDDYLRMTFSPDGRDIYYVKYEADRDLRALYRIPTRGGPISKVLDHVDSPVAFSPDGARFAFVRYDRDRKESSLMIARADGAGERKLVTRREPEWLAFNLTQMAPPGRLAWSPDGEMIAYAVGTLGSNHDHQIWSVPAAGGAERLLLPQKWWGIDAMAWPDDSGLLLLAADEQFTPHQIWRLPFSDGDARRLTNDPDGYTGMNVTADAGTLVAVQFEEAISIWVSPAANLRDATQILSRKADGRWGLAWTTDGKILYDSRAGGRQEIWVMDVDGANPQRLTSGSAADDAPAVSPDGRYIVYASRRRASDATHIWRMDRGGSNPKQLTFGSGEYETQCSPDGRWIVYVSQSNRGISVWRTPIDGGSPMQVTAEDTTNPSPAISPDGRFLAYYRGIGNEKKQIEIIPFAGGAPVKIIKVPETAHLLKWAPDGRALTYADVIGGVTNVWRRLLNGDPPNQLTFFKADGITLFDWSHDGVWLACARKANYEDAILISLD